jgi:hypothetical protein
MRVHVESSSRVKPIGLTSRSNTGCDRRAIKIVSYTKSGYIRYNEVGLIRYVSPPATPWTSASRSPTRTFSDGRGEFVFDTLYINPQAVDPTVKTSRYRLQRLMTDGVAKAAGNGSIVVYEKGMMWQLVTNYGEQYECHPIGFSPFVRTPWTK